MCSFFWVKVPRVVGLDFFLVKIPTGHLTLVFNPIPMDVLSIIKRINGSDLETGATNFRKIDQIVHMFL